MATDVEIANMALLRVGAEPLTALSDDTARARACNAAWPFVRRQVLRSHPWNCVVTRRNLAAAYSFQAVNSNRPVWEFAYSYRLPSNYLRMLEVDGDPDWRIEYAPTDRTLVGTTYSAAQPVRQTATTGRITVQCAGVHSLTSGDFVYLTDATETGLIGYVSEIEVLTTTSFALIDYPTDDWVTDGSTSATSTFYKVTFSKALVTDSGPGLKVTYIRDETNASVFDPSLAHAMALRLAVEVSEKLTGNASKRQALLQEYAIALQEAMVDDGDEQSPAEFEEDDWITARY